MDFELIKINENRYVLKGFSNDLIIIKDKYYLKVYVKEPYYTTKWNAIYGVFTVISYGNFRGLSVDDSDGCIATLNPKLAIIRLHGYSISMGTKDGLLAVVIKKEGITVFRRCL